MASDQGNNPNQPGPAQHIYPDAYALTSQNTAHSQQQHTYNAHDNPHYPGLDRHAQFQPYPQSRHHFQSHAQYHSQHAGQAVRPDHYQTAHEQYLTYSSPSSGVSPTYQHPQQSSSPYPTSVPSPDDLVPRATFVAPVVPVASALTNHSAHSSSSISPVSPISTGLISAMPGYQTTRTHGRYASTTPHGQHNPYPVSSSSHQHQQQQQHSHPQTAFRKRRNQAARMSDESEGEGGESDEGEVPLEKQVPGDISKLSTHSRRKFYVSGLEGYITDAREALRQKGVESPELNRAATSTGLTSATKSDLLTKGRGKVEQVQQTIEKQETHLAQMEKRDPA